MLKPQWWVNCKPLAEEAMKVSPHALLYHDSQEVHSSQRTRAGELQIAPKQSESDWFRWLENIQDWCISRQLWWGHRCPAYFVRIEGQEPDVRSFACFLCSAIIRYRARMASPGLWVVTWKRPRGGRRGSQAAQISR